MIQMSFFIQFRTQLRRTRPALVSSLEDMVAAAASAAGGVVGTGRKVLAAAFDEDRIGFWLDILIFLEKVHKALQKAAPELYAWALVLEKGGLETPVQKISGLLAGRTGRAGSGIWFSEEVSEALKFYLEFNKSGRAGGGDIPEGYSELREFKYLEGGREEYPFHTEPVPQKLPPMIIRFGAGGRALVCFADAFTPELRSFIAGVVPGKTIEELDALHALLFRERLREEWSPYTMEKGRCFIRALLTAYSAAAAGRGQSGVLVMEGASQSDSAALKVFDEVYSSLDDKKGFKIKKTDNFPGDRRDAIQWDRIPLDLWETAYNIALLGRYFPACILPGLFEEEGLNKDVYFRSVRILETLGLFVPDDPRPLIPDFIPRAEKILKQRKENIRRAVRNRLLAWTSSGRLKSCFNFLRILSELGEKAADALILASIRSDVLNGTFEGIDEAINKKYFAALVGTGNAPILAYIFKTLKVLVLGTAGEITRVFEEPVPSMTLENGRPCYGGFQAHEQTNLAAYYIGSRNIDAASEAIRKVRFLNRDLGDDAVPSYRLFSLVSLSRQRIDDALEYISFALDQAEKTEQQEELFLTCYFASSINFLYGNLSKAERLAGRAEETASELGQSGWAERAKFLRGRLCFETGRYQEALEVFQSIGTGGTNGAGGIVPAKTEMIDTLRAWIFRTRNFLNLPAAGELAGSDGRIFEIEAEYLGRNHEKAAAMAGDFLSSAGGNEKDDFLFTEQPDWRSGFSQAENMCRSEKVPGITIVRVYRAMAQCALNLSRTEVLGNMQRFIRDEVLPGTDPNYAFYFYAWLCMLRDFKNTGDSRNPGDSLSAQVDINTVVSMAFKRLQLRAGRIDDPKIKQAYLNQSRWSSALYLAAKDYKLI